MIAEPQDALEKLVVRYEKNPVLRALFQLVPFGVGSAADILVTTTIKNIQEERSRTFFDELGSGSLELNLTLLESEDFLHCFFATTKAALNSRRREKIQMFARLLKSSVVEGNFSDTDEYEEFLGILDEISFRELIILDTLDKYEAQYRQNDKENDLQKTEHYWVAFKKDVEVKAGIPMQEIDGYLTRLNRTGCYETIVGGYLGYDGGRGKLSPNYFRLRKYIQDKEPS